MTEWIFWAPLVVVIIQALFIWRQDRHITNIYRRLSVDDRRLADLERKHLERKRHVV